MILNTLKKFKEKLRKDGYEKKAHLSDDEMGMLLQLLNKDKRALDTSDIELRYIEGLLHLPLGYINSFRVIPKPGFEKCNCGRSPSALDIVHYAYSRQLHNRELIRDTIIGFSNIFEFSDDGRIGECISCGRPVTMFSYWTNGYAYA